MKFSLNLVLKRMPQPGPGWRTLVAALMLWAGGIGGAMAGMTITSITVNGGPSAVVTPSATITVVVRASTTTGTKWRSVGFTTTNASSINYCSDAPDTNGNSTFTYTFTMPAPSTAGLFSLNVYAYSQDGCDTTPAASRTLTGAINTNPPAGLHHVRLMHDGAGLTCSKETLMLRACSNAACSTLYTQSVTVALSTSSGTLSSNSVTFTNGNGSVDLTKTTLGNADLTASVTAPSGGALVQCYVNGVAGTCRVVFDASSCTLDAVEPGGAPATDIYTKLTSAVIALDVLTLQSGSLNTSPTTVTAVLVDASAGGCAGAAVSNSLTKAYVAGNGGRQRYDFTPTKAARNVRVKLTSATSSQCSTDAFAIRPDRFTVVSPAAASLPAGQNSAGADPAGLSATTSNFLRAGQTGFTLEAASFAGYDETPQLNNLRVVAADIAVGDEGAVGTLAGSFGAAIATTGTGKGTAFTYSEVGYFKLLPFAVYDDGDFANIDRLKGHCLTSSALGGDDAVVDPNVAIGGKFGCYFGNVESVYFGRFTPSHFTVEPGPTLLNRSALTTCVAPAFTYVGEPLSVTYKLVARNGAGDVTQNYRGKFVRLNASAKSGVGAVNVDSVTNTRTVFATCGASPAHPCVSAGTATASFEDGVGTITLPVTAARAATRSGPYSQFKIGIAPVDEDTVTLDTASRTLDTATAGVFSHALVGTSDLRYGRMKIENTYGSELLPMGMKVGAQYWNRTGWAVNTLDTCTPLTMAPIPLFTFSDRTGGITLAPVNNMPDSNLLGGTAMQGGAGLIRLGKPTSAPGATGSVLVNSGVSYLPGSGRATFGIYKSGPVIYVRETY